MRLHAFTLRDHSYLGYIALVKIDFIYGLICPHPCLVCHVFEHVLALTMYLVVLSVPLTTWSPKLGYR